MSSKQFVVVWAGLDFAFLTDCNNMSKKESNDWPLLIKPSKNCYSNVSFEYRELNLLQDEACRARL